MASYTRYTLHRADVLFADSSRDIRLGQARGLNLNADKFVLPGAGGIDLQRIDASTRHVELPEELPNAYVVVNARGHRPGSLRQDNFFKTIPIILKKIPDVVFVCPPWRGDAQAEKWMKWTGFQERVRLWPKLTQPQLWALFKKSSIYISPSLHDGVPNSLLEAMACGCFPVVGNIESMQEWIVNGVNGFLVNARDPEFIAEAVISALNNPALLAHSEKINYDLVAERGNYELNMQRVRELYTKKIRGI